jgi:cytochrome c oxidase assembly protein subunit 15
MELARDKHVLYWLTSLVILVLIMIIVGGLTRLTESGLSMVNWDPLMGIIPPMSKLAWIDLFNEYKLYPEFIIKNSSMTLSEFKYIFWWEYGHRVLGRVIGIAFILPLIYFVFKKYFNKKEFFIYGFLLLLGLMQGLIGWWMVKSGLIDNPYVDHIRLATHLFMAQTILMILSYLVLKKIYPSKYEFRNQGHSFKYQFLIFFILTSVTVIYGAFMAGMDAGKSFNTWPLMGDSFIPDSLIGDNGLHELYTNSVFIHFFHRILAYLTCILGVYIFVTSYRYILSNFQKKHLIIIEITIFIQILLGILTIIYEVPILLGALHQLSGSLLLMFTATYTFSLFEK